MNIIKFNLICAPTSNSKLQETNKNGLSDITAVTIAPARLTDIFTNYYHKGEGLLGDSLNSYPNDNESSFIVPGREGLLKLTLNEEFNNFYQN